MLAKEIFGLYSTIACLRFISSKRIFLLNAKVYNPNVCACWLVVIAKSKEIESSSKDKPKKKLNLFLEAGSA